MASWTLQARDRLNAYCDRVRDLLLDQGRADGAEVLADVRAHVEAELAGAPQPISVADAERALATLGDPSRWTAPRKSTAAPKKTRMLASAAIAIAVVGVIAAALFLM